MGEKPAEEIMVQPEYGILEFGDGYIALMQGGTVETDDKGERVAVLMIKPESLLKKRYDIKDSDLDRNGNLVFRAKVDDLIPLNIFDDAKRKWIYLKTFNHEDTDISKVGWKLRERNKWLMNRIFLLEGQLIWYSEQLQLAKTNPAEYISQGTEVFEKMAKVYDSWKEQPKKEEH